MTASAEELLEEPTLLESLAELQSRVAREQAERARFYDEVTDADKAEFINGEVIMHSPAVDRHLMARDNIQRLLGTYCQVHGLGEVRGEKALCVFPRNDYEPDVCFFGPAKAALIEPTTLKFPIPDLIAEVLSDSTEHRDRGVKFRDYAAHGVREYWLVDAEHELLEQYLAQDREYELALKSGSGEVVSAAVEGFRIPIRAIFDTRENLRMLREILR